MPRYYDHGTFQQVLGDKTGDTLIVDLLDDGSLTYAIFESLVPHVVNGEVVYEGIHLKAEATVPALFVAAKREPAPIIAAPTSEPYEIAHLEKKNSILGQGEDSVVAEPAAPPAKPAKAKAKK